jgi:hypothetical protein
MNRWQRARWWTAAFVCVATAPLPPVATWLLYGEHASTMTRLVVTVLGCAVSAHCLIGGLCAAGIARERSEPSAIRPATRPRTPSQPLRWQGRCVGRLPADRSRERHLAQDRHPNTARRARSRTAMRAPRTTHR